ncbi:hypothetical protein [Kineosporia sp. NBRC 101731]|uniref:hypothetical protein n=1 Tax=Kineosporia sp. NBRC 101731 TaxID=3032199 RepID=UPI0024A087F9|nr:hypothetical protein [Kineosporia sp. NBRC 101731]GLY31920.1 hypothetical protein Kisp02_52850 [Kineosporia sp. NBRC 101731]
MDDWPSRRREAFEAHDRARQRAEQAEAEQARQIVADFVTRARALGLPTQPLRARAYSGSATYRTGLIGWYLQPSGSLAIDQEGGFYTLIAPAGLIARLRGVHLAPGDPPLAVGRGARDGESMSLRELLDRRLAAGRDFRRYP